MTSNPNIDIYLNRLLHLRQCGENILKMPPENVNLDAFACGSAYCFLGHWANTERAKLDGWYWDIGVPAYRDDTTSIAAHVYFGISLHQAMMLFSQEHYAGDMHQRLAVLDSIITEKMKVS